MVSSEQRLHIAAGGPSSRLRPYMDELGYPADDSKHLMITGNPGRETLLGRIVRGALADNILSVVHTNHANYEALVNHPDIHESATFVSGGAPDTAFGPFIRPLLQTGELTLAAAGDHYVEGLSWRALLDHHDSNKFPWTFVVGQCSEVDEGAVFDVADSGRITNFGRPPRTSSESLVNIGIYVFDAPQTVLRALAKIGITKETINPLEVSPEAIVSHMVQEGLIGAHVLEPNTSFNVNTPETYNALLQHTAAKAAAAVTA